MPCGPGSEVGCSRMPAERRVCSGGTVSAESPVTPTILAGAPGAGQRSYKSWKSRPHPRRSGPAGGFHGAGAGRVGVVCQIPCGYTLCQRPDAPPGVAFSKRKETGMRKEELTRACLFLAGVASLVLV